MNTYYVLNYLNIIKEKFEFTKSINLSFYVKKIKFNTSDKPL